MIDREPLEQWHLGFTQVWKYSIEFAKFGSGCFVADSWWNDNVFTHGPVGGSSYALVDAGPTSVKCTHDFARAARHIGLVA